jgi:6-phosphogluconolactonase
MPDTTQDLALFSFEDRVGTYEALASALAASVITAFDAGRRARIALSGGASPAPAYAEFAKLDLDWSRVDIALVDDRWVDLNNSGSNEAMVRQVFAYAVGVSIFGMKTAYKTPFEGAQELDPIYVDLRPFDAVVLGMGPDAHTASWFAGSPQLSDCLDAHTDHTVIGVDARAAPVSGDFPLRMTMTLPPISEAGQVILLIYGADKKQILTQALDTPVTQAPIRAAIEACGERLIVFWAN